MSILSEGIRGLMTARYLLMGAGATGLGAIAAGCGGGGPRRTGGTVGLSEQERYLDNCYNMAPYTVYGEAGVEDVLYDRSLYCSPVIDQLLYVPDSHSDLKYYNVNNQCEIVRVWEDAPLLCASCVEYVTVDPSNLFITENPLVYGGWLCESQAPYKSYLEGWDGERAW